MRNLFVNLAISIAALLVSLVVCELVSRVMLPPQRIVDTTVTSTAPSTGAVEHIEDPSGKIDRLLDWSGPRGVRLNPNRSVLIKDHFLSHQDVLIETNSLGLRYRDLDPKEQHEFRVLMLGDSITFGDYVNQMDSLPGQIESSLRDSHGFVKVINAGLPGANTNNEYSHYLELREPVQPDLVLVAVYLNDVHDSSRFYVRALPSPWRESRFLGWLIGRLHIFDQMARPVAPGGIGLDWRENFRAGRDLKSGNMLHSREGFDYEIYNAFMDFGLAWNSESWPIQKEIFRTFADTVRQDGQRLVLTLLPVHMQVMGTVGDRYPQEQFLMMCKELALECLDLLPPLQQAFRAKPDEDIYYDHCHMTPYGNRIAAKALVEWSNGNRLIPAP